MVLPDFLQKNNARYNRKCIFRIRKIECSTNRRFIFLLRKIERSINRRFIFLIRKIERSLTAYGVLRSPVYSAFIITKLCGVVEIVITIIIFMRPRPDQETFRT